MALVVAGMLGGLGTGYLTWSASADERPTTYDDGASSLQLINVDSLYAAKAAEAPEADTSYVAAINPDRTISGRASWYGPGFHGRRTANGERFDRNEMTAAHKSLPFGSLVRVVDAGTGRSVLVRINDRGPYCGGRVLDLSEAAAKRLGITGRGTASTRIELFSLPKAGEDGSVALSFDTDGRAVALHGYTVKLNRFDNFDEAIAAQHRIQEQGHNDVYLTLVREGKKVHYDLSIGLFSSERLCGTLLAEVSDLYNSASIVRVDKAPVATIDASRLTDTTSGERVDL